MKRLRKYLFIAVLLFIPKVVNAECSVTELARLKSIASNITYKYDYVENFNGEYGNAIFTITINNLTDEMIIKYAPTTGLTYNQKQLLNINNGIAILNNAVSGKSHRFEVYASSKTSCEATKLYSFYVATPSYNKYYVDSRCNTYPDFKYCSKWSVVNVSEDTFDSEFNTYIESLNVEEEVEEKETEVDEYEWIYNLIDTMATYVYYVDIPIIVLCIIGIIIQIHRKNKDNYDLKVK